MRDKLNPMNSRPAFPFCVTGNFVSYANSNLAIVYAWALLRRARPYSLATSPPPHYIPQILLGSVYLSLHIRFSAGLSLYIPLPLAIHSALSLTLLAMGIARNYCPLEITRGINVAAQLTVDPLSPNLLTGFALFFFLLRKWWHFVDVFFFSHFYCRLLTGQD